MKKLFLFFLIFLGIFKNQCTDLDLMGRAQLSLLMSPDINDVNFEQFLEEWISENPHLVRKINFKINYFHQLKKDWNDALQNQNVEKAITIGRQLSENGFGIYLNAETFGRQFCENVINGIRGLSKDNFLIGPKDFKPKPYLISKEEKKQIKKQKDIKNKEHKVQSKKLKLKIPITFESLLNAVNSCDIKSLKYLLSKQKISLEFFKTTHLGYTIIHHALRNKPGKSVEEQLKILNLLLEYLKQNAPERMKWYLEILTPIQGWTPFHIAAVHSSDDPRFVMALYDNKVNINATTYKDEKTALDLAQEFGYSNIAEVLKKMVV